MRDADDDAVTLKRLAEASKRIQGRGEKVYEKALANESGIPRSTVAVLMGRYPGKRYLLKVERRKRHIAQGRG